MCMYTCSMHCEYMCVCVSVHKQHVGQRRRSKFIYEQEVGGRVKMGRGEINSLIQGKGSEMSSLVKLLWFRFAIIVQHFGYSSKSYFEKQSILLWLLVASHYSP